MRWSSDILKVFFFYLILKNKIQNEYLKSYLNNYILFGLGRVNKFSCGMMVWHNIRYDTIRQV